MSDNNRIVWSEGLFLRPQHFQQQERHLESWVEGRAGALRPYSWGFTELEIERDLLAIGKLGLRGHAACFRTARRSRCLKTSRCRSRSRSERSCATR